VEPAVRRHGAGHGVAYGVLAVAVVAAGFFAPRRIAAALALPAAWLWLWWDGDHGQGVLAAIVLVMLAILVRGKARLPALWLVLPGELLGLDLLQALVGTASPDLLMTLSWVILWVILGGVALWIVIDARPAIAVAVYIAWQFVEAVGPNAFGAQPQFPWQISAYAAAAAAVTAAAIWQLHRQAASECRALRRATAQAKSECRGRAGITAMSSPGRERPAPSRWPRCRALAIMLMMKLTGA